MRMKTLILIAVLTFPGTGLCVASTQLLAADAAAAAPLDWARILCAVSAAEMDTVFILDSSTGDTTAWSMDWDPVAAGWGGTGAVRQILAPPGSRWMCMAIELLPPESEINGMTVPSPLGVFIVGQDGSGAVLAALASPSEGRSGLNIAFTADSRYLVGSGFYRCFPDPEHFIDFVSGEMSLQLRPAFNMIETASGEVLQLDGLDLSGDYTKCPWADNFLISGGRGSGPYPALVSLDSSVPEVTSVYNPSESYPGIEPRTWVLADAIISTYRARRGLLFTDGRFAPLPDNGLRVYEWFSDGSYILSTDGGSTYMSGQIDWAELQVQNGIQQPGIGDYLDTQLQQMPGTGNRLLSLDRRTGDLYILVLSSAQP